MKIAPNAPTPSSITPLAPAPTTTSTAPGDSSGFAAQLSSASESTSTSTSTSPSAPPSPTPVGSACGDAATAAGGVPKGQLNRTRASIPQGWNNDGGHKGFKPAVISQVAEGYHLAAVNRSDVPRGRQ